MKLKEVRTWTTNQMTLDLYYLETTTSLAIAGSLLIKQYAVITAAVSLDYFGFQQQKADWWSNAYVDALSFILLVDENPA